MTVLRWLIFLLGSLTVTYSRALLDLFISPDASICFTMAFPTLGSSDHVVVSVSVDFKLKKGCHISWHSLWLFSYWLDCLRDHLRDILWVDIFKLGASATGTEFCEGVQVGINIYILHRKYQVKPHSTPWFSATCAATITHRNHFFCLYEQSKACESKVKFRQASNRCERVLEATKLASANKTKASIPRNLVLAAFGELPVGSQQR